MLLGCRRMGTLLRVGCQCPWGCASVEAQHAHTYTRMQELCGFGIYRGLIGHIDKRSPIDAVLQGAAQPQRVTHTCRWLCGGLCVSRCPAASRSVAGRRGVVCGRRPHGECACTHALGVLVVVGVG